jgi:RNA polymerase sigma-70 factor (sigma-E family)
MSPQPLAKSRRRSVLPATQPRSSFVPARVPGAGREVGALGLADGSRRARGSHASIPNPRFELAFPDLYRLAYRVAFKILGDRGDAEDVAQEALARALTRWWRLESEPHGWVSRVASNLAIDRYRRRGRSLPTSSEPSGSVDPYQSERVDLAEALARLPRRQREVVVLRYLGDWSEADVAAELGCSVGTVKTHASRGLAAMRSSLQSPKGEGDV